MDRHPSFGISLKAPHRYRCFSCSESGPLDELLYSLRRFAPGEEYRLGEAVQLIAAAHDDAPDVDIPEWEDEPKHQVQPWPEWYVESFPPATRMMTAVEYLRGRGLNAVTARGLDLRYDPQRRRVLFPLRDFGGALVGLHGRTVCNAQPAYLAYGNDLCPYNPVCWLGEHWVDFDKPVLMVESVFDLAAVWPHYTNAVAPLYAGLFRRKVERMADAFHVVTLFDDDNAGDDARMSVAKWGRHHLLTHVRPVGAKDPGDMDSEVLRELLSAHECIDKQGH